MCSTKFFITLYPSKIYNVRIITINFQINRFLASGDAIFSLALQHRIGESTARSIIYKVCYASYDTLSSIYSRPPIKQAWKNIIKGFYKEWNIPNCVGAVDGKHIVIKAPDNSGSLFFNYKKTHSIVLMASCNHR